MNNHHEEMAKAVSPQAYGAVKSWGLLATINIYGCDREMIKSPKELERFVIELCDLIDMKRHGAPMIERFAEGPLEGYSMLQFIETSSITCHFDEEADRAFIDIFSCKYFNSETAAAFCQEFFKGSHYKMQNIIRS
jgi:S-adenosylmethionine decarboxylase